MQMQDFCEQMEKQSITYEDALAKIEARLDAGVTEVKQQVLMYDEDDEMITEETPRLQLFNTLTARKDTLQPVKEILNP